MKIFKRAGLLLLSLLILLILYILVAWFTLRSTPTIEDVPRGELDNALTLDQNWQPDVRNQQSHISFGSRLMPYDWFLHLELADSTELFRSDATIKRFGYIPSKPSAVNPDGIPIGFAADNNENGKWLGLTCTACHSGQVHYQGTRIHIDGAPGMMEFQLFETEFTKALGALLTQGDKFSRFVSALSPADKKQLRAEIQSRYDFMLLRTKINKTEVPYGYGRLDAFGQIFNAVAVEALNMPENTQVPDGPVSIPVLWDASHLDIVQWNGTAPNAEPGPIAQNATTALAVYGQIDLLNDPVGLGYKSSVQVANLGTIQSNFYKLSAPKWPEDIFGKINNVLSAKGEKIYQENCLSCHSIVDANDPKRKISAVLIPIDVVATDPVMANNFAKAKSNTGPLKGKKILAGLFGEKMSQDVPTVELVLHAASGALAHHPLDSIHSIIKEWRSQMTAELNMKDQFYKARPLNGIWAAAPYLHNGSVPTVYDLLLPASQRPATFYVGSKELDIEKVGFETGQSEYSSYFDTSLHGNSNIGHEMSSHLSEQERWALLEYLKTL